MKVFVRKVGGEIIITCNNKMCKIKITKIGEKKVTVLVDCDNSFEVVRDEVNVRQDIESRKAFLEMIEKEQQLDKKAVIYALQQNSERSNTDTSGVEMPKDDLFAPYRIRKNRRKDRVR